MNIASNPDTPFSSGIGISVTIAVGNGVGSGVEEIENGVTVGDSVEIVV